MKLNSRYSKSDSKIYPGCLLYRCSLSSGRYLKSAFRMQICRTVHHSASCTEVEGLKLLYCGYSGIQVIQHQWPSLNSCSYYTLGMLHYRNWSAGIAYSGYAVCQYGQRIARLSVLFYHHKHHDWSTGNLVSSRTRHGCQEMRRLRMDSHSSGWDKYRDATNTIINLRASCYAGNSYSN